MVLCLKDKNVIYFAINMSFFVFDGADLGCLKIDENIPIWKMENSRNVMIASGHKIRDIDLIRYETLFKGELTYEKVVLKIIPKIKEIMKSNGRLEEGNTLGNQYFIAQKDKAVLIRQDFSFDFIDFCESNMFNDMIKSYLDINVGQDPVNRIYEAIKHTCLNLGYAYSPIAIMDSKTLKLKLIEVPYAN